MKPSHTAIFLAFSGKFLGPHVHHVLPDQAFSLFNNIKALGLNFEVIVARVSIDKNVRMGRKRNTINQFSINSLRIYYRATYVLYISNMFDVKRIPRVSITLQ